MALSTGALTSCANRPPAPTTRTVDLRRLSLLPIAERSPKDEVGPFNLALLTGAPNTYVPVVVAPGMLPYALAQSFRAASESSEAAMRLAIGQALVPVSLSPKHELLQALDLEFAKRGLLVDKLADDAAATLARKDDNFSRLFGQSDALIDIRIPSAGYFPAKRAGGFSPTIFVTMNLLASMGQGIDLEYFKYDADFREADVGEVRFFSAPKAMSVASLGQIGERSAVIRDGMTKIIGLMANQMGDDIERAVKKLPRLE